MQELRQRIKDVRRYREPNAAPEIDCSGFDDWFAGFLAGVALLRRWASEEPGTLGGKGCDRWRPAGSPTRNTLAARFGSWYDALDAAGLAARAAVSPKERDARLRGGENGREQRRLAQRQRVIAALNRCTAALERFPGPTEYARWRIHNDPGAPSFVTAYRLFPGGWDELRAACL